MWQTAMHAAGWRRMSVMHVLSGTWMVPVVTSAPVLWMMDFTLKERRSARRSSGCSGVGVLGQCCIRARTLSGTTGTDDPRVYQYREGNGDRAEQRSSPGPSHPLPIHRSMAIPGSSPLRPPIPRCGQRMSAVNQLGQRRAFESIVIALRRSTHPVKTADISGSGSCQAA